MSTLLSIGSFLLEKKEYYDKFASKTLDSYPVFKWQSYTYEQWENDLNTRLAIISEYDRLQKINEAKAKLERFLTEEDQLNITLKELGF